MPDCKASEGSEKDAVAENNSWPAGLEITEVVCLSLSLIPVVCAFRLYILCVPVIFGRMCSSESRGKGLVVSCGDPGRSCIWEGSFLWEPKVLTSNFKAVLPNLDQIAF